MFPGDKDPNGYADPDAYTWDIIESDGDKSHAIAENLDYHDARQQAATLLKAHRAKGCEAETYTRGFQWLLYDKDGYHCGDIHLEVYEEPPEPEPDITYHVIFQSYCCMRTDLLETRDRTEARDRAAEVLRERRQQSYLVSTLDRGVRWEIEEPEDAALIPDEAGTLHLCAVDHSR